MTLWGVSVVIVFSLVLLIGGAWFGREQARRTRMRRLHQRLRKAKSSEQLAAGLFERCGYQVLGSQVAQPWSVLVDAELVQIVLRADYVVERDGRLWVADVKSGRLAPRLSHGPTRRQLLEYRLAYACEGVLLVDMERARIVEVSFPALRQSQSPLRRAPRVVFAAGVATGAVLAALLVVLIGP